jgi:hypothetical protein
MIQPAPAPAPVPSGPTPAQIAVVRNRAIMHSGARWFYWIAGLSIVNSVVFWTGSTWGFAIGLGMTDAANAFGQVVVTGTAGIVIALFADAVIAGAFVGLGYMAQKGAQWAFIVGLVVYGLDALLMVWATDWLSVVFHGLALYFIYRGFRACRALPPAAPPALTMIPPGMAPPINPR